MKFLVMGAITKHGMSNTTDLFSGIMGYNNQNLNSLNRKPY